jgi:hypothetical protein
LGSLTAESCVNEKGIYFSSITRFNFKELNPIIKDKISAQVTTENKTQGVIILVVLLAIMVTAALN